MNFTLTLSRASARKPAVRRTSPWWTCLLPACLLLLRDRSLALRLATLICALVAGEGTARTGAKAEDYSIAAVEYELGPLDKIGKIKAGLLCLPKGTLRWRDVAREADARTISRLSETLRTSGMSVALPPDVLFSDVAPSTKHRLKIVVEAMTLKLCVAGSSLIEQTPSGSGVVAVRWETYDRERRVLEDTQRFETPLRLDGRDPRGSVAVLADALASGAVRYAATRR